MFNPTAPIAVVGEVLCDLYAEWPGAPLAGARRFVPHLGGAPANVAVQLARLGQPVRLVSAVGADPLGARLRSALAVEGVDITHVRIDRARRTGLTMVELDADGERFFYGWRENAADLSLAPADVERPLKDAWGVVHGTVSLRGGLSRRAIARAQDIVRGRGGLVILDVNLRIGMFSSRDQLMKLARHAVTKADVVKASDDETDALFGVRSRRTHIDRLLDLGARLVLFTRGAKGAVLATRTVRVDVPSPAVNAVDATGAGDAFLGAAVAGLRERVGTAADLDGLSTSALERIGHRACRAGARAVTKMGATTAMIRR